jgi:2-aminoadipate transaminase
MRSSKLRELIAVTTNGPVLSLAGGLPPAEAFPTEALGEAAQRLFRAGDPGLLQYSPTEGDARLLRLIAADAQDRLGLPDPAGRIFVSTGSQQALDLVGKVLLDPGDAVVVESPSYVGALRAFAAYEPRFVPIAVDDQGMETDRLAAALAAGLSPKLCYVVPNFSNPSGATMSDARRRQLAELSARFGFLVVEDDPYGELRFVGADVPPVASHGGNALYLGSFSKTVAPGLRVGYAIAPDPLFRALIVAKQATDLNSSSLSQRLIAELLEQPGWRDRHVAGLRAMYAERAAALVEGLRRHLGDRVQVAMPEGGMFAWATIINPGVDALDLARAAMACGVAVVPGNEFSVIDEFPHALRLSFSMLDAAGLDEAARLLARGLADVSAP